MKNNNKNLPHFSSKNIHKFCHMLSGYKTNFIATIGILHASISRKVV